MADRDELIQQYHGGVEGQGHDTLKKLVGSVALSFIAWGAYHGLATAGLRRLESFALKTLRESSEIKSVALQTLRKASVKAPEKGLWQLLQETNVGSISRLARRWEEASRPAQEFMSRYKDRRFRTLAMIRDFRRMDQPDRVNLLKSAFAEYGKSLAYEAPLFYIGEQAIGIFNRDPRERQKDERPAWWNLPGHAIRFAKWLPSYMAFDIPGRLAIHFAPAARELFQLKTRGALKASPTGEFIQTTLQRAAMYMDRGEAFLHRVGSAYKYAWRQTGGESGYGVFLIRDNQRLSKYRLNKNPVETLVARYRLFRDRYRAARRDIRRNLPISTVHRQFIQGTEGYESAPLFQVLSSIDQQHQKLGSELTENLYRVAVKPKQQGFLPRLLGLVPARLRHVKEVDKDLYDQIYDQLLATAREYNRRFAGREARHIRRSATQLILGRNKTDHLNFLYGENIYYDPIRKKLVNLSGISPREVLGRAIYWTRRMLSFGRRFDTLGLFQFQLLEHQQPKVTILSGHKIIPTSAITNEEYRFKGPLFRFRGSKGMGSEYKGADVPGVGVLVYSPKHKGHQLFVLDRNAGRYIPITDHRLTAIPLEGQSKLYSILAKKYDQLLDIGTPPEIKRSKGIIGKIRRYLYEQLDLFGADTASPSAWEHLKTRIGPYNMRRLFGQRSFARKYGYDFDFYQRNGLINDLSTYLEHVDAALYTINKEAKVILRPEVFKELFKPLQLTKSDPDIKFIEAIQGKHADILANAEDAYEAVKLLFKTLDKGSLKIAEATPEFRSIARAINELQSKELGGLRNELYNPIGEPLADRFRRFLVNYRLTSIASNVPQELTYDVANDRALATRLINAVGNLVGSTATRRDKAFVQMLFTQARFRNITGQDTIRQIAEVEQNYEKLSQLLGVLKQADDAGVLEAFSKEVSWTAKYSPPDNYREQIYGIVQKTYDTDPYLLLHKDKGELFSLAMDYVYDTFGQALDFMGLGFNRARYSHFLPKKVDGKWRGGVAGLMAKRALFFSGVMTAYNALDTFFDVNPMFDGTALDEGLTVAIADQAVNARLLAARIYDIAGITNFAKYMEGLMPKSTSIIPGAAVGFMMGGLPGMLAGAAINRYTQAQLSGGPLSALAILPPVAPFVADLTKSYDELRKIYSGEEEVPYRRGAGWTTGTTPIEGGRIRAWVPNWYVRLKSQYKASPSLYGSKIEEFIFKDLPFLDFSLGDIIAPQYLEKKHYRDRPYVIPSTPFSEVPIVGPLLGATVGRLYNLLHPFASNKPMHVEEARAVLTAEGVSENQRKLWGYGPIYAGAPALGLEGSQQFGQFVSGTMSPYHGEITTPWDTRQLIAEQVYRGFIEPAGLMGFITSAAMWGGNEPYAGEQPVFASADEMDSFRRFYWDENLGDMLLINEGFRRLFPRPRTDYEKVGLIRNEMPSWMPDEFKHSDPYCLTPDSMVEVNGSLVRADAVKPGDLIRTVKGRFYPVKAVAIREVDEEIYVIKIKGLPWEIKVTEEHPFWIDKQWVKARDLTEDMRVTYPLLKISMPDVLHLKKVRGTVNDDVPLTGRIVRLIALLLSSIDRLNSQHFTLSGPCAPEARRLLADLFDVQPSSGIYKVEPLRKLLVRIIEEGLPLNFYGLDLTVFIQFMAVFAHRDETDEYLYFELPTEAITYQAWNILVQHGYVGWIEDRRIYYSRRAARELAMLCGMDINGLPGDPTSWYEYEWNTRFTEYEWLRLEIEYIRREHYRGPVYGYEVDTDDSFCVPGACTHNTKVPFGELLLPGEGYETARNVRLTFPAGPSQLGYSAYEQALRMIGIRDELTEMEEDILDAGTRTHRIIQEMLTRLNKNTKAETLIYDPYHNIKGYVDILIQSKNTRHGYMPIEIKTIGAQGFKRLHWPKSKHITQLNVYLNILNESKGILLYVNRDDPTQIRTFQVRYDPRLYEETMNRLETARQLAAQYLAQGYGNPAQAYSFLDRAKVLINAAPFSQEFRDTWQILQQQKEAGVLGEAEIRELNKLQRQRRAMMWKWEMYPYRFKFSQILSPDTEYQNFSLNENIKAAAEYTLPERIMGSIWEKFTHLRSPLHSKLFGLYSPEEQYERFVLYGREFKNWAKPYQHWIEPYSRGLRSVDDPIQGAISYGIGGWLFGGPVLASITAPLGVAYGIMHGIYRGITGTRYIPDRFEEMSEMSQYFDRVRFYKAQMMYLATRNPEFLKEMQRTTVGWTISAMSERGMASRSRKQHNPAAQGIGKDQGFGSPWRGIIGVSRKALNFIAKGEINAEAIGTFIPILNATYRDRIVKLLNGEVGQIRLLDKERQALRQWIEEFDDSPMILIANNINAKLSRIKQLIRHERSHQYFHTALMELDPPGFYRKTGMTPALEKRVAGFLKQRGYNTKNDYEFVSEMIAHEFEYNRARLLRSSYEDIRASFKRLFPKLPDEELDKLAGSFTDSVRWGDMAIQFNRIKLNRSEDTMQPLMRRLHTAEAQGLGVDRGFGSPWQGVNHNLALVGGQSNENQDPQDTYGQRMGQAIRALPYWDRPFLFPFLSTPPDEQDNILQMVDAQMRMVLNMAWNRRRDISKKELDLTRYFQDHYLPSMMEPVMNPAVNVDDVQMLTAEQAGFDAHDFGLGWMSQEQRIRNSPFNLQAIDINGPSPEPVATDMDSATIKAIIEGALASFGVQNAIIQIRSIPSTSSNSIHLNIDIQRERTNVTRANTIRLFGE